MMHGVLCSSKHDGIRGDSRIEKRGVLRMSAREALAKFWDHAPFPTGGHTHTYLIIRIVICQYN